ncbi:MAG: hypothetical protein K6F66_00320, partial [Pseudobutyrivibrio sp.]|nr:hypothetical protein [Pseudobutyrivibrio sp.]
DMGKVFFVNGFMDAGKTSFISQLLSEEYFKIPGKTLLFVCEEGDVEYDMDMLEENHVFIAYIEREQDFNTDYILEIERKVRPDRVIVEFNGMWDRRSVEFPWYWDDIMEIAIFDATTFDVYSKNMKLMVSEQVKRAFMTVFHKCDTVMSRLSSFRRNIRAVNPKINIVFKDSKGEIKTNFVEDLPYNIDADVINLKDDLFTTFYLDSIELPDRYVGKQVHFVGSVMGLKSEDSRTMMVGRKVMNCCMNDLTMFGVICDYERADRFKPEDWVDITAVVKKEYSDEYEIFYPVCEVTQIARCLEPEKVILDVI